MCMPYGPRLRVASLVIIIWQITGYTGLFLCCLKRDTFR